MLLFSTILEISKTLTKEEFIKLVIKWNQESPHENNVIPDLRWNGERNIRFGNESLWLDIEEYRNEDIIAVRFEKKDADGAIWDSDYVMNFKSMKLSIRLDRSFIEEALAIDPKFSTPHFITLLIENNYLENDAKLSIQKKPYTIDEDNIDLLVDIINGKAKYRLPIVYVSKTNYDDDPINVSLLSSRLKGVAHVLVEKTNSLNMRLKEECNNANEYNGAIGIYYPNKAIGHKRYLYRTYTGSSNILLEKVVSAVIQYSNSQMINTLYTWQGVSSAILRDKLVNQKAERQKAEEARRAVLNEFFSLQSKQETIKQEALKNAQAEAYKILDEFEEELRDNQRKIEALTREIDRLQYENQGLKTKIDKDGATPIIYAGDEDDFYQGEIKDLILSTLSDALQGMDSNSRRADVVRDIINSNKYQALSEKKADTVKQLLKTYEGMNVCTRQTLTDLGFEVTDEGKHHKLTYYGDGRYTIVYGKTPSDKARAGKNNAQTTIKKCF